MDIKELYQELIIDHGTNPRNQGCLTDCTFEKEGINPLCGDKVHVYLKIENNTINDISFEGTGCAISIASASIMTETLKGKTLDEAKEIFHQFINLLTNDDENKIAKETNENDIIQTNKLGKLAAFVGVREFPNRIKCATLPWHALYYSFKK